MAIKISGTTVIDDDRNLISTGIATIGTGSSATTIDGVSGVVNVGTGVTINSVTGDINTIGIVTVGQLSVPVEVSSFSPAIGATDASVSGNIILTFNQTVGLGTTGFFEIKTGLNTTGGTLIQSFGVEDDGVTLTNGGTNLVVDPTSALGFVSSYYVTMSNGFVVANGNNFAGINTVGSGVTYSFTTAPLSLGDPYEGGFLICQSGSTQWIVAPNTSEVSRNWFCRNHSVTTAQSVSGCTGWFVPSCAQLQNPGFTCRTYWDSYSSRYWSNTQGDPQRAWFVPFGPGNPDIYFNLPVTMCVRAFRCVSY